MVVELVLPQSRTPAVEKCEYLNSFTTIAPAVPQWNKVNIKTPGFGSWIIERSLFMCSALVLADGF